VQILGMTKEATDSELSKAYRRLSRDYHPDKQGGKEDKLKELQTAWETLGDAVKRKSYDTYGMQQVRVLFLPECCGGLVRSVSTACFCNSTSKARSEAWSRLILSDYAKLCSLDTAMSTLRRCNRTALSLPVRFFSRFLHAHRHWMISAYLLVRRCRLLQGYLR
jgi:curved DNA-binding protein CbpA